MIYESRMLFKNLYLKQIHSYQCVNGKGYYKKKKKKKKKKLLKPEVFFFFQHAVIATAFLLAK